MSNTFTERLLNNDVINNVIEMRNSIVKNIIPSNTNMSNKNNVLRNRNNNIPNNKNNMNKIKNNEDKIELKYENIYEDVLYEDTTHEDICNKKIIKINYEHNLPTQNDNNYIQPEIIIQTVNESYAYILEKYNEMTEEDNTIYFL